MTATRRIETTVPVAVDAKSSVGATSPAPTLAPSANVQTWDDVQLLPWGQASPSPATPTASAPVLRRRADLRTLADVVLAIAGEVAA